MGSLSTFLKTFSAFAIGTGTASVLLGVRMIEAESGGPLPVDSAATIFADSQFRFLGGIWAGYGAMLWWTSNDLHRRQVPLAILGSAMVLGGIGRAVSGTLYGFGSQLVYAATIVELLVPPAIWLLGNWHGGGDKLLSKR